jgi:D-alanyl-D-alanine carboxypeptidase (penicillin-binding protein 5/6)
MDTITHKTKKGESEFGLTNTNKLIKWYDGATGLKTGSTGKALYCLSGTAERNGLGLIGVVMAAPDYKIRFQEVMKLFDYGFANYTVEKGYPVGQDMGIIPVEKGMKESINVVVKDEISVLMSKGSNGEWETKQEMLPIVKAPIAQGSKVGELIYILDGKEVGRTDLISSEAVEKASIHMMLQRMMKLWC